MGFFLLFQTFKYIYFSLMLTTKNLINVNCVVKNILILIFLTIIYCDAMFWQRSLVFFKMVASNKCYFNQISVFMQGTVRNGAFWLRIVRVMK